MNELKESMLKLVIATQQATQAMQEFSGVMTSFKQRYHPIVWWFLSLRLKG